MSELPVISVVDDDESVRVATTCLMRSLGYTVYSFSSAEEFLRSPHVPETSCLIADVQMPGLSGIELERKLAAGGRRLPVILISAFPEERLKARSLDPERVCFLSKPFDSKDLIACLERMLAASKQDAGTAPAAGAPDKSPQT